MELLSLQKRSILIPTPGQTEQEYLAEKLQQSNACIAVSQDAFNCAEQVALAKDFAYHLPAFLLFEESHMPALLEQALHRP
jgi:UDP-N-acetylglucosamine:LPS N-acetylglucosamine transferase